MTYEEWKQWLASQDVNKLHRDQVLHQANRCIEYQHKMLSKVVEKRDGLVDTLDFLSKRTPPHGMAKSDECLILVCAEFGVSLPEIKATGRFKRVSEARQVLCWLCKNETSSTLDQIGEMISRDHSTVVYSIGKIEKAIFAGAILGRKATRLQKKILDQVPHSIVVSEPVNVQ